MSTVATEIHPREVVRCHRCLLVQFRTHSDLCRRCAYALPSPLRFDTVAREGLSAVGLKTSGPVPFSADRSPHRDTLSLRGKTARELTIGRRLRELRELRSLTQQEMAGRAGVPRTYISRIENARLLPGPLMLQRIAEALAVELLDLLPREQNGAHHSDITHEAFWVVFVRYFSQLPPEKMSEVVSHTRSLAAEQKNRSFVPTLAAEAH